MALQDGCRDVQAEDDEGDVGWWLFVSRRSYLTVIVWVATRIADDKVAWGGC